ncbi:MAG: insulinase family protein [Clostridia bacterium]|nr:insulinase family protein [Clostridia bacterium]
MKVNDKIHGFIIEKERKSAELGGTLWQMRHEKTGAELIWLDNGETNKLFSIAFKTLPWDDTGVFHILEHSVLCGSDKYPVKEPFLDLLKSSMNTFLNAITFADKTMYPVSSRNEQDFLNLTRVYLDAAFCPSIYSNPNIFRQEGWHYEIRNKDDEQTFKGVVFNEMKGAFANVDTLVADGIGKMLFPDNCYGFVSGGDPEKIPDLTYERFIGAHKEFYHPTNAKIYLDGAVPLDKVLQIIDGEYLSKYEKSDAKHEIPLQKPIEHTSRVEEYEIGKEDSEKQKTQMAMGKIVGTFADRKKVMAVDVLSSYLTGTNESPIKRAILEKGLAQDVDIYVDDSVMQPYFVLSIRNTEYDSREEIKSILKDTAKKILDDGIDKEELDATLNMFEFHLREMREPKALIRNIVSLNSWLHGGDPMLYLESNDVLNELRAELKTDYFEKLIEELFLDDDGVAEFYLRPSKTKGDETRAKEAKRLEKTKKSWSDADTERFISENAALDKWQNEPDSPEAHATLPVLSLSDVSDKPEWTDTEIKDYNGVKVMYHPVASNGVVHGRMYFSIADMKLEDMPKLALAVDLLGDLPTKNYTVTELTREIKKNIGSHSFVIDIYSVKDHPELCRVYVRVSFSALEARVPRAVEILTEIMRNTLFDDGGKIKELLLQTIEGMNQSILGRGNGYATRRTLIGVSAASAVSEKTSGFDFFRMLNEFSTDFDNKIGEFMDFAKKAMDKIFVRSRLMMSQTATEIDNNGFGFASILPEGDACKDEYMTVALDGKKRKEAVLIPAGISFAASGGNLVSYGKEFSGALKVLSSVLSYGYLWNEVRVKGGAYGCGFRASETGTVTFHSYRDPNPLNSLETYKNTASFIREFCKSDENIENYIISTISSTEPLRTPSDEGAVADSNMLSGVSYDDRLRIRREMLATTKKEIAALADLFEKMADENSVCVFGNAGALSSLDGTWNVMQMKTSEK